MSGEPRCRKCGKLKLDHKRGFYGRRFCDDEETLFEPAEPSPAPPAEKIPDTVILTGEQFRELQSSLTAMREDRDRAQEALREFVEEWDDLAMNQLSPAYIRAMVVLAKPVSDRQPEGETK